jgi:hypothetical protein
MLSKNSLFEGHFGDAVRAEPSFQSLERPFGARVFSPFMSGVEPRLAAYAQYTF